MTNEYLLQLVSVALRESQRMSGRSDTFSVSDATVPIGTLVDFDSLSGIEVTLLLEQKLNYELPENLFLDQSSGSAASVGHVVARLQELLKTQKGA